MRFVLEINLDNAAFEVRPRDEMVRILVVVAGQLPETPTVGDSGRSRDINGNTVGFWKVED